MCECVCGLVFSRKWGPDTITHSVGAEMKIRRSIRPNARGEVGGGVQMWTDSACAPSYRVGSLAFPAVWVEPLLFVCEGFGLRGKHPPFFTPHFLPFLTEQNADGSETQKEKKQKNRASGP